MPRGTRHELIGILLGGDPYPVLRVADGGEWRLDCPRSCRHLIGQKVRVVGTRSDFDMLDVEQIEPA
ncbi:MULTISPECIES: DUF5818 domain-containing protein [Sphingobium]|jgi:hypothetical protein|uniref:Uncharacterized protein n=1 Tax=Sphingobium yanoikuyae TaxID=13690 RepID=A0A085K0D4_SPHYA|nr:MULTISPECIES: DUF5818 domain-containing protein [Sphingobium]AYO78921.1 hypothetical protein EBF16_19740 [Sphingobium yanoikuyae]KFD26180.1 hypothetical protein IH86_21730 [Sphingobium yanoikuyae]MDV3480813.1 DUF5818 domain-containing protein [Sphingobium yanoikuyae]WHO39343.1 DUF5818 domain-containing protein [Sphingobium sp. AP49]SHL59809.1 hypothetical protein SAMN05518668_10211 [Sphingobium sp. YR657]